MITDKSFNYLVDQVYEVDKNKNSTPPIIQITKAIIPHFLRLFINTPPYIIL